MESVQGRFAQYVKKQIDVRFDESVMSMLKSMIGKMFNQFKCDSFDYSPMVYGLVGLYIDNKIYKFDNFIEVQDFYGALEDVAILKIHTAEDGEIQSCGEGILMVETPIMAKITGIRVVDENQRLYVKGEQTYNVWLTRGLIFDLEDGREVSFEKSIWFSEFIHVQRGYDLLKTYQPTDVFLEEWEENEEYRGECDRVIRTLS